LNRHLDSDVITKAGGRPIGLSENLLLFSYGMETSAMQRRPVPPKRLQEAEGFDKRFDDEQYK